MFQFSVLLEEVLLQLGTDVRPGQLGYADPADDIASDMIMSSDGLAVDAGQCPSSISWRGTHICQNENHLLRIMFP